jgi:cardiolipin synthase
MRLLSVPVAMWLILDGRMLPAFWLFLIAGISDAVDGFLAKRLNSQTALGGYLDPLADKTLLVGVYLTLGYQGYLDTWLVILVVFRDLLIVGGALFLLTLAQAISFKPLWVSKLNTVAQIALAVWILARHGFGFDDSGMTDTLIYIVAATTLLSGFGYLWRWGRRSANLGSTR